MPIKLKNGSVDVKFKQIERILNRMSRKLHKTVIGVMPPIPIMSSVYAPNDDGTIGTFLLPGQGMITDVCMYVQNFEGEGPVEFEASIKGEVVGAHTRFRTRKNLNIQKLDMQVFPGDILTVKTLTPERITGIWIAFLYQLKIDRKGTEKFLVDELLKIVEGENDQINEDS